MKKILLTALFLTLSFKAFAAAPDLTIGSVTGYAGQTVGIPVIADFSVPVFSLMFTVKYDPALLTPTSVTVGSSDASWFIDDNPNTAGTLIVGMFSAQGTAITNAGQQVAVINFTVKTGPGTLPNPNLMLSSIVFDTASITAVTNGNFTLSLFGDVDGNGKIDINDAIAVSMYSVGLITLTPTQLAAADVSKDGKVTIYDAAIIAQYVAGIIKGF